MGMTRFRLIALPVLIGLGQLTSSSGGRMAQLAIARAAVAPIDAVLERNAARLCADFVPSVAEKLVRTSASGEAAKPLSRACSRTPRRPKRGR